MTMKKNLLVHSLEDGIHYRVCASLAWCAKQSVGTSEPIFQLIIVWFLLHLPVNGLYNVVKFRHKLLRSLWKANIPTKCSAHPATSPLGTPSVKSLALELNLHINSIKMIGCQYFFS